MFDGIDIAGGLTPETKLFRYVRLSQFLSFVEEKQLVLTRIKQWEDTWEVPHRTIPFRDENGKLDRPIYTIYDDMLGQCWSLHEESDALWRIYSPNREGLVIRTTVQAFEQLTDIRFGVLAPVVYYRDLMEGIRDIEGKKDYFHIFASAFLKREAFAHEKEVRLVTLNDERHVTSYQLGAEHIPIRVDPASFVQGVIIDPRASDWFVTMIRSYCQRAGFSCKPVQSRLYSSDIYESTGIVTQITPVKPNDKVDGTHE